VGVKYNDNVHFFCMYVCICMYVGMYIIYLFRSSPVQTGWSIFTINGSNDVVWRKEVPFGGENHKNSTFGGLRPRKPPLFAPQIGNPSQTKMLNNFLTVRDRQISVMEHK
jgi:hypothetical protein